MTQVSAGLASSPVSCTIRNPCQSKTNILRRGTASERFNSCAVFVSDRGPHCYDRVLG